MKISISPFLVLRIPRFSITDQIASVWDDLKESIRISSPDFYEKIEMVGISDLSAIDPKIQYTIWKYFNRSKYRGTPYGSFAGFTTAELSDTGTGVIVDDKQHLHVFKDWGLRGDPIIDDSILFDQGRLFFANTSIYVTTGSIRFLCMQNGLFELAEIERSIFIEELLDKSKNKITYKQLCLFATVNEVEEDVMRGILRSLIGLQLLFTDLDRNIIGDDYFDRVGQKLSKTDDTYLIAERKIIGGTINKGLLRSLPACINYLLSIQTVNEQDDLKNFKTAFVRRFEYQEISLMKALDPEFGLSYGGLENAVQADTLINELLEVKSSKQVSKTNQLNELSGYLLNAILEHKGNRRQAVNLAGYEQEDIPATARKAMPANSFSALLRFADDLVVLDSIGGVTANALAGRFTLASKAIELHCKDICAFESNANPDVIFFDMAYMAEGKVDNINRRKTLYDYELPLLNYSSSKNLIDLDDLLVTVKAGEIILLSRKYKKRVVPRLASAYNYSRSDLPVYRLLCDLQHQHIQSQILFDVQSLLPGLNFYPRIQHENIVLSTAKWRVKAADFKTNGIGNQLDAMEVCRYFTAGNGDQTLLFDRESENDMTFFKRYLDQYKDFMISETIVSENQKVNDNSMKPYFTQFLVALSHSEQLYKPYFPAAPKSQKGVSGAITPGKDWLYFEIYCHNQRTDSILNDAIAKFVNQYKIHFKCWFFIRYNDPSNHIRIRFQLKEIKDGYYYTHIFMKMLEDDFEADLITDVQIKTYKRELQRYGYDRIERIEQHFEVDSDYALNIINEDLSHHAIYANCIRLMKAVISDLNLSNKAQLSFIKGIQDSFITEHHLENGDFKKINKEYAAFTNNHDVTNETFILPERLLGSFKKVICTCDDESKLNLYCDLFHMHINRLFNNNQRTHELIIYSFFYKQLQREHKNVVYA